MATYRDLRDRDLVRVVVGDGIDAIGSGCVDADEGGSMGSAAGCGDAVGGEVAVAAAGVEGEAGSEAEEQENGQPTPAVGEEEAEQRRDGDATEEVAGDGGP